MVVGVMMERGMDVILSILGTLKSGGAFLPLDPRYPSDRLQFMIEDSGVSLILSQKKLDGIVSTSSSRIVFVDEIQNEVSLEDDHGLGSTSNPDNLAYMIYTSGSTGKPKGARLGHRGLNNLSEWQKHAFNITTESRVLQFSPLSFDASVWEIFMALGNGACLVLAPQDRLASGVELVRLLQQERVSTVTLPPSMLAVMPEENLPDLKTVIAAGEACSNELVNKWGRGRQFVDAYGPTETTVCATAGECTFGQKEPPSIGRPIDNAVVYILDAHQQVVPVGVKGELYVGGAGLARGYWKRDELTAEKFVANPLPGARGDRLYRTGDLVKYRADGQIDFLGRIDNQVKLRGFRIELGEIEAALRGCEGVSDATVIVREDVPGVKRLVGYVVAAELSDGWEEWFRASLRTRLPEYMVPPVLMRLDALPLSPSGKINRKALPAPDINGAQRDRIFSAPRDEVEKDLARIYEDLLGIERASVTDNFFELGGHSLLATQLISRVRETFKVELPLRTLFEAPSLADLASQIKNSQKEETSDVATVEDLIKEFKSQSAEDIERVLSQGNFFDGTGRN
jgi:amino acid adenylation domain-containing protein